MTEPTDDKPLGAPAANPPVPEVRESAGANPAKEPASVGANPAKEPASAGAEEVALSATAGETRAAEPAKEPAKETPPGETIISPRKAPAGFQSRAMSMTPGSLNEAERTIDVVLSTGAAVRRRDWDGNEYDEVLDMSPKAIRLERVNRGAPFIDSHDYWGGTRSVIGAFVPGTARVERGSLIATAKFSRSPDGERIMQDVKDGVLRNVSVGYVTHEVNVDKKTSPETRRAVDWEPHEGSVVAIPADPQAGFRNLDLPATEQRKPNTMTEPATAAVAAPAAAPAVDQRAVDAAVAAGVAAEMSRRSEIADIARDLGLPEALATEHVTKGTSLDAFRAVAITAKGKAEKATGPAAAEFTFADRDEMRGMPTIMPHARLKTPEPGVRAAQMLISVAAARSLGVSPVDVCAKRFGADSYSVRALQASIGSTGGYLIPIELSSELIELLRPKTVVRNATPTSRQISLPRGNLTIGRQNTGATVGYIGEGQSTAYTQEVIGDITFQAKKAKAIVPISNDLIRFAQSSADMIVRDDLVRQLAVLEDQNFLRSAGSQWAPKGLRYLAASANILDATVSSYTVTTAIADLESMVNQLENAYVPMTSPHWFWSAKTKNWLYDARDSVGGFLFRAEMDRGMFRGYPFSWTQNIPNNLGGSSNQSEVYLVDMDEFYIADVPGLMINSSQDASYSSDGSSLTNSAFDRDETVIRIIAEHDCNIKHTASVCVLTEVPYGN